METDLKAGCVESLRAGNLRGWRDSRRILADYYEDEGRQTRADWSRRKAAIRRVPGCLWPRPGLLRDISHHQREQLRYAFPEPVGLLTGTPGTGKTYTSARAIGALIQEYGLGNVALCAPTGKAAVRLTQALRSYRVPAVATTIHSLLEIGRNGHDGQGWGFQRNEARPLSERFVIVDEASMLDCDLFSHLLRACSDGTHLLLIGDPYQLPPVGHGAPLRDLIASGLPRGHLTEIRRNAGLIVRAAQQIKDGKRFDVCDRFVPEEGLNLRHIECTSEEDQVREVEAVLNAFRRSGRFDPVWDCQVIVPTHASGPLGRKVLNRTLQGLLNPEGEECPPNPFRLHDKIICTKNRWCPLVREAGHDDDEAYVANGEIGQVVAVEPRSTAARFTDPERIVLIHMGRPRDEDEDGEGCTGCDFQLGYAITCHRAQGSEWPCVILPADGSRGARRVCTREWIYTAVTRASQLCLTIGRLGVLHQMVARVSLEKRKTFLVEQLR